MLPIADAFEYEYRGCMILYGRDRVAELGSFLGDRGLEDALVVCGSNVGANAALMDPIRSGLGDRYAGTYDGTTPEKRVESAAELLEERDRTDADVLVAVGGGSSLDIARQATLLAADERNLDDLRAEAAESSLEPFSGDPSIPFVVVPTTFAGADVSGGGSLEVFSAEESPTGQPLTVGGSVMPIADVADPTLFETSPTGVLAGSAMNGFNKGIETPYASDASPVSDAAAIHGLRLLSGSLSHAVNTAGRDDADARRSMDRAVVGALLVQLDRKISIIHAFGHGFARRYDVQQGAVHAILAPAVLEYLFEEIDASRHALAAGLGVESDDDDAVATAVVSAVEDVRNGMDLPTRLRDLQPVTEADLPAIAEFIVGDHPMERAPADLDATADDIEAVLRKAW